MKLTMELTHLQVKYFDLLQIIFIYSIHIYFCLIYMHNYVDQRFFWDVKTLLVIYLLLILQIFFREYMFVN